MFSGRRKHALLALLASIVVLFGVGAAGAEAHTGTVTITVGSCPTEGKGGAVVKIHLHVESFPQGKQTVVRHVRESGSQWFLAEYSVNVDSHGRGDLDTYYEPIGLGATSGDVYFSWTADGGSETPTAHFNVPSCAPPPTGSASISVGECLTNETQVAVVVRGEFQNFPAGTNNVTLHYSVGYKGPWEEKSESFQGSSGSVTETFYFNAGGGITPPFSAYFSWPGGKMSFSNLASANLPNCPPPSPAPQEQPPSEQPPTTTPPAATPTPVPPGPTTPKPNGPKTKVLHFRAVVGYFNHDPVHVQMSAAGCKQKEWITIKHPGITHGLQSFRVHYRCGKIIHSSVRWYIARRIDKHGRMVGARRITAKHRGYGTYSWTTRGVIMRSYLFDLGHWSRPGAWGKYVVVVKGDARVASS